MHKAVLAGITAFRHCSPDWGRVRPALLFLSLETKKARKSRAFSLSFLRSLTLGELEALTGFRLAVLLAFHDAAVAGQEASGLQSATQAGFKQLQRL